MSCLCMHVLCLGVQGRSHSTKDRCTPGSRTLPLSLHVLCPGAQGVLASILSSRQEKQMHSRIKNSPPLIAFALACPQWSRQTEQMHISMKHSRALCMHVLWLVQGRLQGRQNRCTAGLRTVVLCMHVLWLVQDGLQGRQDRCTAGSITVALCMHLS